MKKLLMFCLVFLISACGNQPNVPEISAANTESTSIPEVRTVSTVNKDEALDKLYATEDGVLNRTIYVDKDIPGDLTSTSDVMDSFYANQVYPYLIATDEGAHLRWIVRYVGDDWLFIDKFYVNSDDTLHEVVLDSQPNREVLANADVSETVDMPIDAELLAIIQDIISSEETILRLSGKSHYLDLLITRKHKQAMKNVLDGYEAITGKPLSNPEIISPQSVEELQEQILGKWQEIGKDTAHMYLGDGTWTKYFPSRSDELPWPGTYAFPNDGMINYSFHYTETFDGIERPVEIVGSGEIFIEGDKMLISGIASSDEMKYFSEYERID